jgi:hypothetical protein
MSPAASDDLPQFKADWIEQALEAKALIFGDFTLKSGRCVLVRPASAWLGRRPHEGTPSRSASSCPGWPCYRGYFQIRDSTA